MDVNGGNSPADITFDIDDDASPGAHATMAGEENGGGERPVEEVNVAPAWEFGHIYRGMTEAESLKADSAGCRRHHRVLRAVHRWSGRAVSFTRPLRPSPVALMNGTPPAVTGIVTSTIPIGGPPATSPMTSCRRTPNRKKK